MKHLPSDKYNVAWFKLAECVGRGEKEKALGVYRLLVHSLDDPALARQLEGDILWSFKDATATEKYAAAAQLYEQYKRPTEAAAVYEHLIMLHPDSENYLHKAVELYQQLKSSVKVASYAQPLINSYLAKNEAEKASAFLESIDSGPAVSLMTQMHQQVFFALLIVPSISLQTLKYHIYKVIDGFLSNAADKELQHFLSKLQSVSEQYYQVAYEYLQPNP